MPERSQLVAASVVASIDASKSNYSVQSAIGYRQFIQALTTPGRFTPGTYRCNANTIWLGTGQCELTDVPLQPLQNQPSLKRGVSGEVAAYLYIMQTAKLLAYQPSAWNSGLERESVSKSYAKVMQSELEVGVMLGELRETIEGLRNPLAALRKELSWLKRNWDKLLNLEDALQTAGYFKSLRITDSIDRLTKRLALGGVPRTANALAGTWLEWRYGIRPLIQSVQDILKQVEAQNRAFSEKLQRRKGKTKKVVTTSKSVIGRSFTDLYVEAQVTETKTVWSSASTAFRFDSPLTWQQRYGLDFSAVPEVAWELIPLSFVVDWFVNVGAWLGALRVLSAPVTLLGTSVSQRTDTTIEVLPTKFTAYTSQLKANSIGAAKFEFRELQRKCLSPGFGTFLPSINSASFDLKRTLDAIALTYQRIPNLNFLRSR